jgi:hypothetical protein
VCVCVCVCERERERERESKRDGCMHGSDMHDCHGSYLSANVQFLNRQPKHSSRPRPPPVDISHHLDLINHAHLHSGLKIDHFNGGGSVRGSIEQDLLLPCDEVAFNLVATNRSFAHLVVNLPGKEPERAAIAPALALRESPQSIVRLASAQRGKKAFGEAEEA